MLKNIESLLKKKRLKEILNYRDIDQNIEFNLQQISL